MKKLIFPLAVLIILLAGCAKEGPVGPAGASGANNVSTTTYLVAASDWQLIGTSFYANLSAPQITQNTIDSGAVMVYMFAPANTAFETPLPFTTSSQVGYDFNIVPGKIELAIVNTTVTPHDMDFRVVVIKGQ